MDDLLEVDFTIDDSGASETYIRRPIKDRINPITAFDNDEFFRRFRVNKEGFAYIYSLVEHRLEEYETNRNSPIPPVIQLGLAIRFYSSGDFQITNGDLFGISQSTMSRKIVAVSQVIASLSADLIRFPNHEQTIEINNFFLKYANFPGVSGIVDGTHIPIQSPGGSEAELYRNRKGHFSINCQVVCDHKHKFSNVVARWPGSVHDSRIWTNSRICKEFEEGQHQGIILGDSAYPLSPQLMTPFDYPCKDRQRGRYNRSLCRSRVFIGQSIGIWKRRFPILSKKMRCKVETTLTIIVATAVLHNLCIELNQPLPGASIRAVADDTRLYDEEPFVPGPDFVFQGIDIRDAIVERFAA